jgi:hypothetical protein
MTIEWEVVWVRAQARVLVWRARGCVGATDAGQGFGSSMFLFTALPSHPVDYRLTFRINYLAIFSYVRCCLYASC